MAHDPKTGYHGIWLVPVVFVILNTRTCASKICQLYARMRVKYMNWRHPEIARIKKLAGVDK